MSATEYKDISVEITGKIGIIKVHIPANLGSRSVKPPSKFNRPNALNSFGGKLLQETLNAFRDLNQHPDTVFTVLMGEGRFFSAGANIRGKVTTKGT